MRDDNGPRKDPEILKMSRGGVVVGLSVGMLVLS